MNIRAGNILDIKSGIILHQANCQGVMGAGLALQLKKKWPVVYTDYRTKYEQKGLYLGDIIISRVEEKNDVYVASICSQKFYGRGKVFTDYEYLRKCMKALSTNRMQIYVPYGIGCGIAGGDWNVVSKIIDEVLPLAIVIKLP